MSIIILRKNCIVQLILLLNSLKITARLLQEHLNLFEHLLIERLQVGSRCSCVHSPPSAAWASCPSVILHFGFFAEDTFLCIFSPCVPGVLFCSGRSYISELGVLPISPERKRVVPWSRHARLV